MDPKVIKQLNIWGHLICFAVVFFCHANAVNVVSYLSRFGYLPPELENSETANLVTDESLKSALENFQTFQGLKATGVADKDTLELMRKPRCGVPDKVWTNSRSENYIVLGDQWKWRTSNLTYFVSSYPSYGFITKQEVNIVIKEVLDIWSSHTNLIFRKGSSRSADIYVKFVAGSHWEDNKVFDGPGFVLAHAFYPGSGLGGDAHFDNEEMWIRNYTTRRYSDYDLEDLVELGTVALHEIGHSLGLLHSNCYNAVMYAYYNSTRPLYLDEDDINGIQALYGKKVWFKPHEVTPKYVTGIPGIEICNNQLPSYTFFTDYDDSTYLLFGDYFWLIKEDGIPPQYPQLIFDKWDKLMGYVDAAFAYKGVTYFFKSVYVWAYKDSVLKPGFPGMIKRYFPSFPNYVDSVLVWKDKVYAFKGKKYWRHDGRASGKPINVIQYPREIEKWGRDIPTNIDSAMTYSNGYSYFFKGPYYWRYSFKIFGVDQDRIPFPRNMSDWWLFCRSDKLRPSGNL